MTLTYVRGLGPKTGPQQRLISLEEVADTQYSDMAELALIFQHEIIEVEDVWRWKPNTFINWLQDNAGVYTPSAMENAASNTPHYGQHCTEMRASLSLNTLTMDLYAGAFSMEEWMKFYMQIGYSLSGYAEVFGQREASQIGLPGALVPPNDEQDFYTETVIDYMIRIHKGQVLKL